MPNEDQDKEMATGFGKNVSGDHDQSFFTGIKGMLQEIISSKDNKTGYNSQEILL